MMLTRGLKYSARVSSLSISSRANSRYISSSSNVLRNGTNLMRCILSCGLFTVAAGSFLLTATNNKMKLSSIRMSLCEGAATSADKFEGTKFYPPITAYKNGMLKVSNVHTIAYSEYGNPNGKPVLFVHGGPGGGTDPAVSLKYEFLYSIKLRYYFH